MYRQFAQRAAATSAFNFSNPKHVISTSIQSKSIRSAKPSKFSQSSIYTSRRQLSTTSEQPKPTAPEELSSTIPAQTTKPKKSTEALLRQAAVYTLDALFACATAYLALEGYNFIVWQPPVIDLIHAKVQESPFMIEHLGSPIKRDWLWMGNVEPHSCRVEYGVSGPKGKGAIEAKGFQVSEDKWEFVYLYGILPEFGSRLTDLLPVDENEVNLYPYIPSPDDPSAAHALTGAPTFPHTPVSPTHPESLPPIDHSYTPFERDPNQPQWTPERAKNSPEEIEYLKKLQMGREELDKIGSQITHEFLHELDQYQSLTTQPDDGMTMKEAIEHQYNAEQQILSHSPSPQPHGFELAEILNNRTANSV